jgi:hypothetical protein
MRLRLVNAPGDVAHFDGAPPTLRIVLRPLRSPSYAPSPIRTSGRTIRDTYEPVSLRAKAANDLLALHRRLFSCRWIVSGLRTSTELGTIELVDEREAS